jgi:hypothetical protein
MSGELWRESDDDLIERAAMCSQFKPLCADVPEEDESLRECIKLNVCNPLRERIAELEKERDEAAKAPGSFEGLRLVMRHGNDPDRDRAPTPAEVRNWLAVLRDKDGGTP